MKTWLSLITLILLIVPSTLPVSAQSDPLYHYTGFMSDDTGEFAVKHKFSAGDFIFVFAEATSDDLDPYLILKDFKGTTLIENDDINLSSLDSMLGFHVERDGAYEIVLSNVEGTSGDYQLSIWQMSDLEMVDELVTEESFLSSDDEGSHELELVEGQIILLQTETLEGDLDPYIFLVDPYQNIIALNDDFNGTELDSYLAYVVPETGVYEVAVMAWLDTSGSYVVSAQIFESASELPMLPVKTTTFADRVAELTEQSDEVMEGFVGDDLESVRYTVTLEAGAGLIVRGESQHRVLDMAVRIYTLDENMLSDSDEWSSYNFSPITYFIAPETGMYIVEVSAENDTAGDFVVGFEYTDSEELIKKMRVELSGPPLRVETDHFIVHYTSEGDDAITDKQAYFIADILENIYDVQINEMGWAIPLEDGLRGGDNRFDVYIKNIYAESSILGYVAPEYPILDNPNSKYLEEYAMSGYLVVDGILADETPEDAQRILIATLAHEFHHLVQFGYNATGGIWWYYEATATYMEVATLPPYNEALIYVDSVMSYPEICLGASGSADPTEGSLMYGTWLFIQSLVDVYGDGMLKTYWQNLALHGHGWQALEITLADYGTTLHDVVARYHIQNLLRGYELAPLFEGQDHVWLEAIYDDVGVWNMGASGVQELGVNYNLIALEDGLYHFSLVDAPYDLWLYGVGINTQKGTADIYNLGYSGSVDISGYHDFVLMTFNTGYHDELDSCEYASYSINIQEGNAPISYTMDAINYIKVYEEEEKTDKQPEFDADEE